MKEAECRKLRANSSRKLKRFGGLTWQVVDTISRFGSEVQATVNTDVIIMLAPLLQNKEFCVV